MYGFAIATSGKYLQYTNIHCDFLETVALLELIIMINTSCVLVMLYNVISTCFFLICPFVFTRRGIVFSNNCICKLHHYITTLPIQCCFFLFSYVNSKATHTTIDCISSDPHFYTSFDLFERNALFQEWLPTTVSKLSLSKWARSYTAHLGVKKTQLCIVFVFSQFLWDIYSLAKDLIWYLHSWVCYFSINKSSSPSW